MSKCPFCNNELPKMTPEEFDEIKKQLFAIPGFLEELGKEAAKKYLNK